MTKKEELKAQILELTREYYKEVHAPKKEFVPGKSFVNYGGRYFDDQGMYYLQPYHVTFCIIIFLCDMEVHLLLYLE